MSYGTVCLICRKYIGTLEWHCKCPHPIPSDDGKTPNTQEVE